MFQYLSNLKKKVKNNKRITGIGPCLSYDVNKWFLFLHQRKAESDNYQKGPLLKVNEGICMVYWQTIKPGHHVIKSMSERSPFSRDERSSLQNNKWNDP